MHTLSSRLFANEKIQTRLRQIRNDVIKAYELRHRTKPTAERIMERYASIAFTDIRQLVDHDEYGMTVKPTQEWPDEAAEAVASIKNTKEGVEISLRDPMTALNALAEMSGMKKAAPSLSTGGVVIEKAIVMLPDNGRDAPLALPAAPIHVGGNGTNGTRTHVESRAVLDLPSAADPEPDPKPRSNDDEAADELGL